MATAPYRLNIQIGTGDTAIDLVDGVVRYFQYKCMWDRGNISYFLIFDPSLEFHNLLSKLQVEDPTPRITFRLVRAFGRQETASTRRIMYLLQIGLITLKDGLHVKMVAIDLAGVQLRKQTAFSRNGVRASEFCNALAQAQGVTTDIPETGDDQQAHRAVEGETIEQIRYELDRTLSKNGNPISLQYDDRIDKNRLQGYEMPYGGDGDYLTELLENTFSPQAVYNYGPNNAANENTGSTFGSAIYDMESNQDYSPAIWGHQVSVDQLGVENQHVVGKLPQKLGAKLGIGGRILNDSHRRLHIPREPSDSAVSDEFRVNAVMTNALFQSEMNMTYGSLLVDSDFAGFDDPAILNRKHVKIAITAGSNQKNERGLIPKEAVVMGWAHFIGQRSEGFTRIFFRRGR